LLAWGRSNFQRYDWRTEEDPWLTLAAEFFLQRTRARQAERVFREFRQEYPTADALAEAGPAAAERVMEQLGIRWRAPLFHALAEAIRQRGGVPPHSLEELRAFTGVGPYTAAAWLSLHRGVRAVIVDSNVARLLSRLTGRPYPPDPRHVRWVNDLADRLTPKRAFRDYNYAVLDFTMSICTVRAPRCDRCPLRPDCAFGRNRDQSPDSA
jgi:A/G-specific adenine glycosylase